MKALGEYLTSEEDDLRTKGIIAMILILTVYATVIQVSIFYR